MYIAKKYISPYAQNVLKTNSLAATAYNEIYASISKMTSPGTDIFIINNSQKNCNGVVPIKDNCYECLEDHYKWFREKPLNCLSEKGGPIDVYKEFSCDNLRFNVGLEFETGNISSAHRSMNKLSLALKERELHLAVLLLPISKLSYYLTDRVSNYEELEPYFRLLSDFPFIVLGFDAEKYDPSAPLLPKGNDGMSKRSIRRWQ